MTISQFSMACSQMRVATTPFGKYVWENPLREQKLGHTNRFCVSNALEITQPYIVRSLCEPIWSESEIINIFLKNNLCIL